MPKYDKKDAKRHPFFAVIYDDRKLLLQDDLEQLLVVEHLVLGAEADLLIDALAQCVV